MPLCWYSLSFFFSPPLLSSLQCLQIPFGFESGLTTASGCHYGLPVVRVGTVAGGKNTGNIGARRVCHGLDISCLVEFEIIFEHISVRFVSDGKEEAIYRKVVTFLVSSPPAEIPGVRSDEVLCRWLRMSCRCFRYWPVSPAHKAQC